MRVALALAVLVAAGGCHGHGHGTQPPAGLSVDVTLGAPTATGDVAIASVALHFGSVVAVSDRAADDARATLTDVDLSLGDSMPLTLPSAPPGLYSAVGARLGSSADFGLDVQGVWRTARVHATLTSAPFDVACATPVRLDPGGSAHLTLRADPTNWFDEVDLMSATSDADDNGIVISEDDNLPMARALLANVVASFTLDCAAQ
jgi:hypothetical protein